MVDDIKMEEALDDESSQMKGWMVKQKRGFAVTRWFELQKNRLLYFKSPTVSNLLSSLPFHSNLIIYF